MVNALTARINVSMADSGLSVRAEADAMEAGERCEADGSSVDVVISSKRRISARNAAMSAGVCVIRAA